MIEKVKGKRYKVKGNMEFEYVLCSMAAVFGNDR